MVIFQGTIMLLVLSSRHSPFNMIHLSRASCGSRALFVDCWICGGVVKGCLILKSSDNLHPAGGKSISADVIKVFDCKACQAQGNIHRCWICTSRSEVACEEYVAAELGPTRCDASMASIVILNRRLKQHMCSLRTAHIDRLQHCN